MSRTRPGFGPRRHPLNGILIVDKPTGMTSHDVVQRIRRRLDTRHVGHLGTLDPGATGVLPLTLGKATRLARFIPTAPKEYTGEIHLGWATTTGDVEGEPLGEPRSLDGVSPETLSEAMEAQKGTVEQIPPAYSAKKISGVAAYRLARKGVDVQLDPVTVEIENFALVALDPPVVSFRVVCSGGTYVRSLARDLGERLGTGAHLLSLRRTRSGPFEIHEAVSLDEASAEDLIPPEDLMGHLTRIEVDETLQNRLRHGRAIECSEEGSPVRIFNKKGRLIAIATVERGWAHPKVVLL